MTSNSETGHVKNVANFEAIISFCTAYGTAYDPSRDSLKLEALEALLSQSRNALSAVTTAKNRLDLVINDRQIAFKTLRTTATRIMNALQAAGSSKLTIDDAKSINNKIQGKSSSTKTGENKEKRSISTSQQSYDKLTENFSKLLDLVTSDPDYQPNEESLKTETLANYLHELQATNTAVINANTNYSNTLIQRDEIIYAPATGLIDTALDIKKYIKSVFGATSSQYKQISKLEFKRPK